VKKHIKICLIFGSAFILANFGSQESTIESNKKFKINFYGTIEPRNGNSFDVSNLAIGNAYKQIPFYEKPEKGETTSQRALLSDPRDRKKSIVTLIDLAEIQSITVPEPTVLWVYQKDKGYRAEEYVEVIIHTDGEARHYLKDLDRGEISCEETSASGPLEKKIPFTAIKTLTIKGFKHRDEVDKDHPCVKRCIKECETHKQ